MRAVPRYVAADDISYDYYFEASHLAKLSAAEIQNAMFRAAHQRYLKEIEDSFLELMFGANVEKCLRGFRVLDFGCYFGGTAIAWEQKYGTKSMAGFDVSQIYADGANAYAGHVKSSAVFKAGFGEAAPYPDNSFDTIVALDVFEHVYDPAACFRECWRMLVPGGHLILVFPPFHGPFAHHLKVSFFPALHWLFSGRTINEAQNAIHKSRGPEFDHFHDTLPEQYKIPLLNGLTKRAAMRLIRSQGWQVIEDKTWGVPKLGHRASKWPFRIVRLFTTALAHVPILDEVFQDRVAVILRKP